MSILNKILAVFSAIASFFAAVFFVLFKLKKEENKNIKDDIQEKENTIIEQDKIIDFQKKNEEEKKEIKKKNDEELKKIITGNKLDDFNNMVDFLSK